MKVDSRPTNCSRSHGANDDKFRCIGVATAVLDVDRGVDGVDEIDDGDDGFKGVRVDFRVSRAPGVVDDIVEQKFRMTIAELETKEYLVQVTTARLHRIIFVTDSKS